MSRAGAAKLGRMADAARRSILLAVPDVGRVTTVRHRGRDRIVLDFYPDLKGSDRYLWSFAGKAFESREAAEAVRQRICNDHRHVPLVDAVAAYKSRRARVHQAETVIARYLEAAATLQSDRTGAFLRQRTIDAYRRVLTRAAPFYAGMTIAELCEPRTLRELKAWFRLPSEQGGRGLQSDQEARNAFAALRAVVAWYRLERPDFPPPDWPVMPTAASAKRRGPGRRTGRLTFAEAVRGIDAAEPGWQPILWTLFYTQARPTEARGVLGADWARPRLTIARSARTKRAGSPIDDTTKTGETGVYELPDWLCDLIDRHRASIAPDAPLFQNPHPRAVAGTIGEDALIDAWRRATKRAGIAWVPPYRAFKHTQVTALRDAGMSIEAILAQTRLSNEATLAFYDERQDERRGEVVAHIEAAVRRVRGDTE